MRYSTSAFLTFACATKLAGGAKTRLSFRTDSMVLMSISPLNSRDAAQMADLMPIIAAISVHRAWNALHNRTIARSVMLEFVPRRSAQSALAMQPRAHFEP